MLSLEKQRLSQRVMEEQGHLVVFCAESHEAGDVLRDMYFQTLDAEPEPMPPLAVVAKASYEEAHRQQQRYFGGSFLCMIPAPYYYKVVAE